MSPPLPGGEHRPPPDPEGRRPPPFAAGFGGAGPPGPDLGDDDDDRPDDPESPLLSREDLHALDDPALDAVCGDGAGLPPPWPPQRPVGGAWRGRARPHRAVAGRA